MPFVGRGRWCPLCMGAGREGQEGQGVVERVACAHGASVPLARAPGGECGLPTKRGQGVAMHLACAPLVALAILDATDARAGPGPGTAAAVLQLVYVVCVSM